eukprot:COSAG02_NODE_966_length_15587_cov_19.602376_8_plen_543_part_00
MRRESPRQPTSECAAPGEVDGDVWVAHDDDPPAVAKARQLGSKAKQLSQAGQSKKACRYSYEAARRFLLEEHSCSCAVAAAVAAAQLIEDADADIGVDASPSQDSVAHNTFANLPDLYTGCSADVSDAFPPIRTVLSCSASVRVLNAFSLQLHHQQVELLTNTKLSCSSGMRWAGWLVLARMIYRAQSAASQGPKILSTDGSARVVAALSFWRYIPEPTAEACYTAALQQILPWSHVCTVARELQGPLYSGDERGDENGHHEFSPAGSAAAFRSAERMCAHDIWSKLAEALSTKGPDSSMIAEERTGKFAPADICRLLVTVLVEASCVTTDPSVGYTLLCLAREAATAFGSYAEEAAVLHAMAYVVRIGWPQSKGSDLYASELLLRAACAWRSSILREVPSSPALVLTAPDGFVHLADDTDANQQIPQEHQHQQERRTIGLVDSSAAAEQAQVCASLALSTALAHDDLVRAAAAAAVAEDLRGCLDATTTWEPLQRQHRWLLELFEARRALSYEWFECEMEARQVPSAQQALFASVHALVDP